ncbi:MAG TPA: tetratricopeptide repeat protein [Pyrinomonadaceae bacterium]|nr:tetratricopeptide repeat protein [Pyrinomonadaceae bacterium]
MRFITTFILSIFIIGLLYIQADACLWTAGQPQVGKSFKIDGLNADDFMKKFVTHEDREYWEKLKTEIEKQQTGYPFMEVRNNLAVALIHLGNIGEAIKILEELEKKKPGEYFTATNLGTAYELNGENENALIWIKEGIKRNKNSHFGTEWLHVKILEAKLAIEKDSDWLKNNSVLGADFSDLSAEKISVTAQDGQKKSLTEIEEALVYQLHERLEFVKPPEPIVADLLSDLSKTFSVTRTPEHAKAVKDLAVQYSANSENTPKSNEPEKISGGEKKYFYLIISAIIAFLLITGIYIFRRNRITNQF